METRHIALFLCLMVGVCCAQETDPRKAHIIESNRIVKPDGSYDFRYLTSDGVYRSETGTLKYTADQKPYIFVNGVYYYKNEKGENYEVKYESGIEGYKQRITPMVKEAENEVLHFPPALLGSLVGGGLG